MNDTKQEADSVITFYNYLINIIDNSKTSFEEDSFLERVYDRYFVSTKEYADLLVAEIPNRQRANIAIKIILDRNNGDIDSLSYFMSSLFDKLDEAEITRVYKAVSDELKFATESIDIRTILKICPSEHWVKIDKAVRLRIEAILFEDVKAGTYDNDSKKCGENGALGTWVEKEHMLRFNNIENWTWMLVNKLESNNVKERDLATQRILCK